MSVSFVDSNLTKLRNSYRRNSSVSSTSSKTNDKLAPIVNSLSSSPSNSQFNHQRVCFDTISTLSPTSSSIFRPSLSSSSNRSSFSTFSVSAKHSQFRASYGSRTFLCNLANSPSGCRASRAAIHWLTSVLMEDGDELICLKLCKDPEEAGTSLHDQAQQALETIIDMVDPGLAIQISVELVLGKIKDIVQRTMLLYQPCLVVVGIGESATYTTLRGMVSKTTIASYLINHSPVPVIVVPASLVHEIEAPDAWTSIDTGVDIDNNESDDVPQQSQPESKLITSTTPTLVVSSCDSQSGNDSTPAVTFDLPSIEDLKTGSAQKTCDPPTNRRQSFLDLVQSRKHVSSAEEDNKDISTGYQSLILDPQGTSGQRSYSDSSVQKPDIKDLVQRRRSDDQKEATNSNRTAPTNFNSNKQPTFNPNTLGLLYDRTDSPAPLNPADSYISSANSDSSAPKLLFSLPTPPSQYADRKFSVGSNAITDDEDDLGMSTSKSRSGSMTSVDSDITRHANGKAAKSGRSSNWTSKLVKSFKLRKLSTTTLSTSRSH